MKIISKTYKNYIKICLIVFLFLFLSACNGITPTLPFINSFTANPTSIISGESSTLTWNVTNATTLTINPGNMTFISPSGSKTVSPTTTTTYTLTATNSQGSVSSPVSVTVGAAYGTIDIQSTPSEAKIYLDGIDTGFLTPAVLTNLGAGTHTVKLEKYYYKNREETNVLVTADDTTYLDWSLTIAPTETLILQPGSEGKDADVGESSPNQNSGNYTELWVGYNIAKWRTYLQFDLNPNPLPVDAILTHAYLKLYQHGGSGSLSLGVYQVLGNWSESAITWNNQPASSSVEIHFQNIYTSTGTWRTWYIKDLVKGWIDGSISNYGILLKPTDELSNNNNAFFISSDYYLTYSTICPKIEINYYVP